MAHLANETPRVSVAQIGSRMHYAVPRTLERHGMLEYLYTDVCASTGLGKALSAVPESLQAGGLKRLAGRVIEDVPAHKIYTEDLIGLKKAFYYALRNRYADFEAINLKHISQWCRAVARRPIGGSTHLYAFNSCALEVFASRRWQSSTCVLEQTIAPLPKQKSMLEQGQSRFSGFDWKIETGRPSFSRAWEREQEEWSLAAKIVCGSEFVRQSIVELGAAPGKCEVIPYGFGETLKANAMLRKGRRREQRKLNVLFVGAVGLRKGAPIVLAVAKACAKIASIRVVGQADCPPDFERELRQWCEMPGVIPRAEMGRQYAWADVFLLPSLCEGSATVTYEACSAGVPVICTPNTGSTITDGRSGYIVPAFEADPIIDHLESLHSMPDLLESLSLGAIKLSSTQTEAAYGARLAGLFT